MNILTTTFVLILVAASAVAQEKTSFNNETKWVRFESSYRDFSFSLPEKGYLVDNDGGTCRLHFVTSEIAIRVDLTATTKAKDGFNLSYDFEEEKKYQLVKAGDFLIGKFAALNEKKEPDQIWLHLASSKGSYFLKAATQDTSNPIFRRFIDSIRINNEPLFSAEKDYPSELRTISATLLKSDAVILEALEKPDSQQKNVEKAAGPSEQRKEKDIGYSRPLIIIRKPRVTTYSAKSSIISGTVKLKVTFLANGTIGNILLLKSLDPQIDKDTFNSAKKIKFLPAEINGKSVDMTKVIEYSFLLY